MKRISFVVREMNLSLLLAFLFVMPLYLSAQEIFQISLPIQHGFGSYYTGHGLDFSQSRSREFHYSTANPLQVYQYTDYDCTYEEDNGSTIYEEDFAFSGEAQIFADHVVIKVPASIDSPFSYREMTIDNNGYMQKDLYYASAYRWLEFYYYYDAQNLATGYLKREIPQGNPPTIHYTKHEYTTDAEGRRLFDAISVSLDSLTWVPDETVHYAYTGDAFNTTKNYEKYWPYLARDFGLLFTDILMAPYVCPNWVLASITHTSSENVHTVYDYLYAQNETMLYGNQYSEYGYWWNHLGLPTTHRHPGDSGFSDYTFSWNTVSVGNNELIEPPIQPGLSVYPNPFNPSGTIKYSLTKAGEPSLKVYNLKGQLLRSFQPGPQTAGDHSWEFDGKDACGQSLSSGVYLLRLSMPGLNLSKRMTLMK